ncbi:hypothetical protein ACFS5J_11580 [Flavobacterium chuncheonense]|uniref:Uncharacterized protein n=1 Tax=Flavobacterium chuncheonense TaxID=2026653 RepID=A0ABW5YNV1_9FLAO
MKKIFSLLLFIAAFFAEAQIQHCGYDFTSYLVVDAHEDGKVVNVSTLKISVVNENGSAVINVNNSYSWNNSNQPMVFKQNYLINKEGEKERYFFPYAKDQYFLSVANTFPAENFSIKIEDTAGVYKTQTIPLQSFNMYVLCSSENERQSRMFGPRTNRPIEVILEKK